MKKRLFSLLMVMVLCISLIAGCAKKNEDDNTTNVTPEVTQTPDTTEGENTDGTTTTFGLTPFEERQTLRVGFFAGSPLSIPFYIADMEGFWDELNIDIVYETFTNGPAMMEANADWDVAGAGAGGLITGMVGYDVKLIGISDYETNLALLAREGSKLVENPDDPESWKGTTWLYPVGTTAQATLVAALDKVGLDISDVNSVNMDISSALTAFLGGEGDGLGVWNAVAFNAEDEGFIRVTDAGELGVTAPCATVATNKALTEKRDLVKTAFAVFYRTWEWANESDENMDKAVAYYLENCEEEGIAVNESIAERVMARYMCPTFEEAVELMTKTSPDDQGLFTERDLIQAEKDLLVVMDFFISQEKYTPEDRTKILTGRYIDPSIAVETKEMVDSLGIK